jgi:hypothetical protein
MKPTRDSYFSKTTFPRRWFLFYWHFAVQLEGVCCFLVNQTKDGFSPDILAEQAGKEVPC